MKKTIFLMMSALFVSFAFTGCEEILDELIAALDQTGWQKDKENMDNIPEDITPFDDNKNNLASRISLEDKFPPIGNQGQYGTCVAWSTGYNLKTALNAIEKGWKSTQLADPDNQTSPKDLWMLIPSDSKGAKCDGTQFEAALDALIANGGATMRSVPYDNLGNCTGSKTGNSGNKLANYRKQPRTHTRPMN